MAPVLDKSSPLVTAEVTIAGVEVLALIDTGATSSCCRWGWYDQWKTHLGPLGQTETLVLGVGNVPVELKGITQVLELEWDSIRDHCQMMVLPTLEDVDVILGMDVISRLDVQISGRSKAAVPRPEGTTSETIQVGQKMVIPAGKSRVFFVANKLASLTLFEPSDRLPEGLLGLPTLSEGARIAIQLDNLTEDDIALTPEWEVGTISSVHLAQAPTEGQLPPIPASLTSEQQRDLRKLLQEYQDVFSKQGDPISSTSLVEHEIHTTGRPIRQPFRRQNPIIREIEQQQVKEMLRDGVIRPSSSPWASPVVMVKKKDGSMRFCVDFRQMNDATIKDAHPLPRIDDTLESLYGAQYFTTLDLKSGYWQVPITEEDKEKTAFRTSSGQLYEFNQLPFGLCNAPATFSRLMDRTLAGLAWNICLYYLDDIIVFSSTWAEHIQRLKAVFERLRRANLKLGAKKCTLAAREVSFLGYKVTPDGLEPEPRLMEAISKLPPPINVAEVRSFLGLVGYYRRFVKKFSDKAAPLNALLRKEQAWKWTEDCQEAFETLKGEIAARPVSAYPDFSKPFRLYTDASNIGLGAILAQKQQGKEKIICCASRTLNNAESNYSTTKKECLAVVWGVQVFRPFLVATHFEILTDHYALQWLRSMKSTSAILHRWAAALEDYRFTVLHRPGKLQGHVDALSRLPTENLLFTVEGKIKVPEKKAEEIIKEVHRQGHLGEHKTWKAFNRKYFTPAGKQKCREVVRTCPECQLGKDYKVKHLPKGNISSPGPWETVSIDIVGPLPVDGRSNRFIVTIMDVYSRYLIAVPVKNHRAATVSRCLYESVVAYFGAPRSILSDRGTEFTSIIWETLSQMLGAKIKLTAPYYPQGNAVIERSHRTLNNMLRTMLLEKERREWSSLVPSIMLYMNSMIQEKTGVSAGEILFGRNPNLPSDISFTPATSLSDDKEGYVKQLKRDLQDIRQKLGRVLGQEPNQSSNPFAVGEKVIIAILPHERTDKLMAKWKGPFVVTKIPNRFQIEYIEDGVNRLTHISYAKKFNERCHSFAQAASPREQRASRAQKRVRMARIRLICGKGRRPRRMVVPSAKAIRDKWPIFAGKIRIQVLGDEKLPADLQAIVDATGPDWCIEGEDLVDLCKQRSEEGESGCNAPEAFSASPVVLASGCDSPEAMEESPVPSASPPTSSVSSVVQVRRYSWRSYAKNAICEKRREFVGTNRQTNTNSSLFSPQKPLVSRVHLAKVVRKIGQQERSKGKTMDVHEFNALGFKGGKDMTSESHLNRKNNLGNNKVNSGDNKCYKNDITNSLASKGKRGEEGDEAHRLPGLIKGKGKMTSLLHNTVSATQQQQSTSLAVRVAKQCNSRNVCSRSSGGLRLGKALQSCVKIAAMLFICFGIIMQLSEAFSCFTRGSSKRRIGNSRIVSVDGGVGWCYLLAVYFLFECRTSLWKFRHRIWSKIILEGLWIGKNVINTVNKRFYGLTFRLVLVKHWLRNLLRGNVCSTNVAVRIGNADDVRDAKNVCFCLYLDLWASCQVYLYRDMGILELLYAIGSFRIFIYLYKGKIRSLWLSCEPASFFLAFPNKLCTLVYFVSKDCLLGKINHKKYPCTDLVGLAPSEKAYDENKLFCVGLRRVVTSGDPLDMAYKRGHRTLEK